MEERPEPPPFAAPAAPQAPPPARATPVVSAPTPLTYTIVALNVGVFLVQMILVVTMGRSGQVSRAIMHVPTVESLAFGANQASLTIGDGQVERLLTACFLHGGIIHLAFNMLVLWQAGPLVERSVGKARMAPMYLLSGILSSLASALSGWLGHHPERMSVGASGAIMGVIASALVLAWRSEGWSSPLTQSIVRWLGLNLVLGFVITGSGINVDNAAHIGGAIAGALTAIAWKRGRIHSKGTQVTVLVGCAAIVVATAVLVATRDNQLGLLSFDFE